MKERRREREEGIKVKERGIHRERRSGRRTAAQRREREQRARERERKRVRRRKSTIVVSLPPDRRGDGANDPENGSVLRRDV